jgi:hypothetical protein
MKLIYLLFFVILFETKFNYDNDLLIKFCSLKSQETEYLF